MRRLNDTILRLSSTPKLAGMMPTILPSRLKPLPSAGSNPGALVGSYYVPDGGGRLPLVVVLHGCTQNAAVYDHGAGWSALAERHGFALLFPEQQRANNPNLCFNWFSPDDNHRDVGEALSIRQMVAAMIDRHPIDPARIFVTGLSAGGAMTSVMLASYPEVFAGGAIIAGLPFAAASSVPEAFDRMRGHGHVDGDAYAAAVRGASVHGGPWPTVSVWHGSADRTVAAMNADAIIGQWRSLHGAGIAPDRDEMVDGVRHRAWRDRAGRDAIQDYRIDRMGHGTPLGTAGTTACGSPGAYMLDVGISSTWHIAADWGLIDDIQAAVTRTPPATPAMPVQAGGIQGTIEAALRSAGLMR
ncbi:alpha/beta hydrolase family esterase [uncultured Sphingomonas sp.]|uniref:extracellular catalytic domain type 1 short-chain-length polyhydroxyalkanoate depolymerase n=1 Tax=uncultured Sphingomonas sp. TaxID=158754 RepID=UPI0035C98632